MKRFGMSDSFRPYGSLRLLCYGTSMVNTESGLPLLYQDLCKPEIELTILCPPVQALPLAHLGIPHSFRYTCWWGLKRVYCSGFIILLAYDIWLQFYFFCLWRLYDHPLPTNLRFKVSCEIFLKAHTHKKPTKIW